MLQYDTAASAMYQQKETTHANGTKTLIGGSETAERKGVRKLIEEQYDQFLEAI
jgi:hypothetical protein